MVGRQHRLNNSFRKMVSHFDYPDVLLLDLNGNVVYTVDKGPDLGTNILTGPYRESNLHDAYQKRWVPMRTTSSGSPISSPINLNSAPPPLGWCAYRDRRHIFGGYGATVADLENRSDHDRRQTMESRRDGHHNRDITGRCGRFDAF